MILLKVKFLVAVAAFFIASLDAVAQQPIRVAVATNFKAAFESLAQEFHQLGYRKPIAIYGSSGKHAAQIIQGLPVDLFLSADSARPLFLSSKLGLSDANIRTYAVGRLVMYSPGQGANKSTVLDSLLQSTTISIANPNLAPYGAAAREVLRQVTASSSKTIKIVQGENVGQAFNLVKAGGASVGLVARSQVMELDITQYRLIPQKYHSPISQDLLVIRESPEVTAFVDFLFSDVGLEIITRHGYDIRQ